MAITYDDFGGSNRRHPQTGDGGNVGADEYLEMILGPPHPDKIYKLPKDTFIKTVIVKSVVDQVCSCVATGIRWTKDVFPETVFTAGNVETFAPNVHYEDAVVFDSFNANDTENLYVTIIYQKVKI